jgi:hypothetical protein
VFACYECILFEHTASFISDMSDAEQGNDEYTNAKKLVARAANREALLDTQSASSQTGADFSNLKLKPDHNARPCWTCPDGAIYLEAFHSLYTSAYDFLVAIAEPVARPEFLHEYRLTPYSLYAAVATNIETESIIKVLDRLSKNVLPVGVANFIRECTKRYGKAKLVLKHNKFYVESEYPAVLRELLRDSKISQSRVAEETSTAGDDADAGIDKDGFVVNEKAAEMEEVSWNLMIMKSRPPYIVVAINFNWFMKCLIHKLSLYLTTGMHFPNLRI